MNTTPANHPRATDRIAQVSRLFGQGLVAKEAAQQLGISVSTVMSYVRRIQRQRNLSDLHRVYCWCVEQEIRRQYRPSPGSPQSKLTISSSPTSTQIPYVL